MMKSIAAAGLSIAAAIPAMADAQTIVTQPPIAGTRLEISVRGEVRRVPDIAVISAGVVTQAVDAGQAMRDNAARMVRVLASLRKAGVAERDISTTAVNLAPQYRYNNNQPPVITGYQANNQVTVQFRDVAKSGAILDALVKEGSNEISGPNLMIDKPEAAQDEARIAAMTAARSRAELYASATGLKVKRIISISESEAEGGRPIPMTMMKASREAADTPIVPGEQSVAMNVSVVFELQ